ncbi:MAG: hypothetical protein EOP40_08540 [Rubrivivax sp.]|nr:MAG: hypothetical protein EOP40_08540 [Rubrivivax sp.]
MSTMSSTSRPLMGPALVILLSSVGVQAQAAGWTLLPGGTVFDLSSQNIEVNGQPHGQTVFGELQDLSDAGTWLHTTASVHTEATAAGLLALGREGTVLIDASGGASAALLLSATQTLMLDGGEAASLSSLSWTQDVATQVRLQIIGSEGEAPGQRVRVTFSGLADLLHGGGQALDLSGGSQLDLAFTVNGQMLSSLGVNGNGSFSQALDTSFNAVVGDVIEITLAAHQALSQTGQTAWPAGQPMSLDRSAFLQGSLSVAAVPEADLAWLVLGGGLVLLPALRARRQGRHAQA